MNPLYGTAPIRDAYWKQVSLEEKEDYDRIVRDVLASTTAPVNVDDDWQNSNAIILQITDEGIKYSKGAIDFLSPPKEHQ